MVDNQRNIRVEECEHLGDLDGTLDIVSAAGCATLFMRVRNDVGHIVISGDQAAIDRLTLALTDNDFATIVNPR
jgi:hypothetical protein